jgi:hypothetical protein
MMCDFFIGIIIAYVIWHWINSEAAQSRQRDNWDRQAEQSYQQFERDIGES